MIKRMLKRLLEYCPRPSESLTTTLKRYSIPATILISVSIVLASFYFLFLGAPTQPIPPQTIPPPPPPELPTAEPNYYPGVIVGDYVKYGDYFCNVSHPTGPGWEWLVCLGERDWMKVEVVEVSGIGVTLRYTEQLKNGSATSHNGCVHVIDDIEHSTWVNGSNTDCYVDTWEIGRIVAANLTEGDSIHSTGPCGMPPHTVNKTEIRNYLGVSRCVNIMKLISEPTEKTWVFDVESGMMLEYEEIVPNNERTAYRIVETNIFPSPSPSTRSSLIQKNNEIPASTETSYDLTVDDWVETEFKIWIGNGELNSPEEKDVVSQTHDDKDYLLVKEWMSEEFWLPPPTEEDAEYEGGWYLALGEVNLDPDEEPEYCGTCDINDQDLIDKLIEIGIYPINAKNVSCILIGHVTGNLWMTENDTGPLADFWHFVIHWEIGTLEIPNPEWQPDPIIIPHRFMLEGETDRGIEPEGEYDQTTDTWTVTFDTVFELFENTIEPPDPETGDTSNKLWEGPLRFTVEIQRIPPQ